MLPRSSWADYDASLISPGGGVYSRHAKSIPITAPVISALGLPGTTSMMTPPELLQAILRAPVDLIYNGGIGTYIKASSETHGEVGDKANDPIRINGNEVRARIIAEGGNLGVTQLGRIEAALGGVLLNTDAIDNSAGVDCSDHEVNIKIFIDRMIATGRMAASERTGFLHSLTDEVARLVLKNNRDQNTLLHNDRALVLDWSPGFERTMDWLENASDLDRRAGRTAGHRTAPCAAAERQRPHGTRTVRAGGVREDRTCQGAERKRRRRGSLVRTGAPQLLPASARGPLWPGAQCPPAAPADHLHRPGQRHDQPRRNHLRLPDHRGNHCHRRGCCQGIRCNPRSLRPAAVRGPGGRAARRRSPANTPQN